MPSLIDVNYVNSLAPDVGGELRDHRISLLIVDGQFAALNGVHIVRAIAFDRRQRDSSGVTFGYGQHARGSRRRMNERNAALHSTVQRCDPKGSIDVADPALHSV